MVTNRCKTMFDKHCYERLKKTVKFVDDFILQYLICPHRGIIHAFITHFLNLFTLYQNK